MAAHLRALCDELKVTFIDTTPRLKEQTAAGEVVYLPFDTHLSPRGHEIVADLIAKDLNLMPREARTTK